MKKIAATLCLIVGLFVLNSSQANAQVFFKPTNHIAIPARVTSLQADVDVIGNIAVTQWSITIPLEQTGSGDSGLCDFISYRPTDAKVTAFTIGDYTGKVVRKEAMQLKATFPASPNDPLKSSGLNGTNSFRSMIHSLSYWDKVVIKTTWVQIVAPGDTYRFPLTKLCGVSTRLGNLRVTVRMLNAKNGTLSNNYNLPATSTKTGRTIILSQKNYRALRDLTVSNNSSSASKDIPYLVTARDGVNYFALCVSKDAAFKVRGIGFNSLETSEVETREYAGGTLLLITGQFKGKSEPVTVSVEGERNSTEVVAKPVPSNEARALWASTKIARLSEKNGDFRDEIIRLSEENSVASSYTTWLATTDEDLRMYHYVLLDNQLSPLVREYWLEAADGRNGARSRRLKSAISHIALANGLSVEDELYMRLGSTYNFVVWQKYNSYGRTASARDKRRVPGRLTRLSQYMLDYLKSNGIKNPSRSIDWASPVYSGELYTLRQDIMKEYRQESPNYSKLNEWEHRFAQLYGSTYIDPRLNFWRARIKSQDLDVDTSGALRSDDNKTLERIKSERIENSRNAYFVNNIGDPPIYVCAPADAKQVIALMPDGTIKPLEYNTVRKRWEGNYDVPTTTREGRYEIRIIIVQQDGKRREYAMPFQVDTTAPTGSGQTALSSTQDSLRLEISHSGDVARVLALLPWGEKASLLPSTMQSARFYGTTIIPTEYKGKSFRVIYILTDRAHNRTTIETEVKAATP